MPYRGQPPGQPFGPDWQLRALIARQGYGNAVSRELAVLLRGLYRDLARELAEGNVTDWQRQRLQTWLQFAEARLQEVTRQGQAITANRLGAAADVEAAALHAQANALREVFGLPSRQQLIAVARYSEIVRDLDIGGTPFREWWQQSAAQALARTRVAVQRGIVMGDGPHEIARRLWTREAGVRTVARMHEAQWHMAVRTTYAAVQSAATEAELRAMGDVIEELEVLSTLDLRTSDICRSLSGKRYRLDDPALPRPPLHPNCRTVMIPVVPGVNGERQTMEAWLRDQSPAEQDAALGRGRAAYWRSGQVRLDELVMADGRSVTLAQLRARLGAPASPLDDFAGVP